MRPLLPIPPEPLPAPWRERLAKEAEFRKADVAAALVWAYRRGFLAGLLAGGVAYLVLSGAGKWPWF